MKTIYSILFVSIVLFFSACSKDDIDTYQESKSSVRFLSTSLCRAEADLGGNAYSSVDQAVFVNYSFLDNPMDSYHEYDIPVALIGKTSQEDRKIGYAIQETSTAPEDAYEIVDAVIPADSLYGYIRVKLLNKAELGEQTYQLDLKIVGNEQLAAGPKAYLTAHLSWNNQIPEPPHNNLVRSYNLLIKGMAAPTSTSKACYSPNAMKAIVAALGWDDWDDVSVHGSQANTSAAYKHYKYLPNYAWIFIDNSYLGYQAKLNDWLKEYKEKTGSPLLHDAGSLIGKPVEARNY